MSPAPMLDIALCLGNLDLADEIWAIMYREWDRPFSD